MTIMLMDTSSHTNHHGQATFFMERVQDLVGLFAYKISRVVLVAKVEKTLTKDLDSGQTTNLEKKINRFSVFSLHSVAEMRCCIM